MSKLQVLAATVMIATGVAATAHSASVGCSGGELTLSRLNDSACIARIPLPTARPGAKEAVSDSGQEESAPTASRTWEFIETPAAGPGETRLVRLVGPRFLPDRSEVIDFRAPANVDFINAAFQRTVSYLGLASQPKPVAKVQAGNVQEARADLGLRLSAN